MLYNSELNYHELFFQIIAFILIGTATVGKTSAIIESLPIIGGIAASGVFLLIISVIGLYGAVKHNQVSSEHYS